MGVILNFKIVKNHSEYLKHYKWVSFKYSLGFKTPNEVYNELGGALPIRI